MIDPWQNYRDLVVACTDHVDLTKDLYVAGFVSALTHSTYRRIPCAYWYPERIVPFAGTLDAWISIQQGLYDRFCRTRDMLPADTSSYPYEDGMIAAWEFLLSVAKSEDHHA